MYVAKTLLAGGTVGDRDANLDAIVTTFEGLDDWLSHGGFLPDSWER